MWQLKMNFARFFGCKKLCLDKADQMAVKAIDKVSQEMKMTRWLKDMRVIKHVLKRNFTKKQWQTLCKKQELRPVTMDGGVKDSDEDEEMYLKQPRRTTMAPVDTQEATAQPTANHLLQSRSKSVRFESTGKLVVESFALRSSLKRSTINEVEHQMEG